MPNPPHQRRGVMMILAAALMWSSAGVLIRVIHWNPYAMAAVRSWVALLILLPYWWRIDFRLPPSAFCIGSVVFAVSITTFLISAVVSGPATAAFLQYTAPGYVALFGGVYLQERTSARDWICVFLALLGSGLFFYDSLGLGHLSGDVLGIISGMAYGWLTLVLRKFHRSSTVHIIFGGNFLVALGGLPFIFASSPADAGSWLPLILLGSVALAFPFLLFAHAVRYVSAMEATLYPTLEPILNSLWLALFLNEKLSIVSIFGACFVILSNWLVILDRHHEQRPLPAHDR